MNESKYKLAALIIQRWFSISACWEGGSIAVPNTAFKIEASLQKMLKAPPLKSSDLHISVFQGRSERGVFNIFEKYVRKSSKIKKGVLDKKRLTMLYA